MTYSSGHIDTFAADNLPPSELWPVMDCSAEWLNYPELLNCANELLDRSVRSGRGDAPLCLFASGTWSYAEFLSHANRIANVLVDDLKLVPGNRVLLRGPNSPMLAALWFAVLKAGGICVTTMPLLRAKELAYVVQKAQISIAICDSNWLSEMEQTKDESEILTRIVSFCGFPFVGKSDGSSSELETLMATKPTTFANVATAASDVALIGFTSGTTGRAKATMHFHRDIMAICDSFPRSTLKPVPEDIFIGTPPFAFTFGLGGQLLFPMRYGASTILLEKTAPEDLISAIEKYRATVCFSSPTAYRAMLACNRPTALKSLRKTVSAGEVLPLATYRAWHDSTGLKMIDGIGATELLHIFISAADDEIKPGATGRAIPGYQAKIVGKNGEDLPPGEIGLLAVRGPTGCRYLSDNDRQREYVRSGWNFTGDSYFMDEEGYFHYQARADDMIISSGYNISGPEVENTLLTHPKVKECAVVAAPDEERGNIVKAYIVLNDRKDETLETVKELQDFVKNEIAPYKYPRAVEFVATLPRTETGKLQRFRLRS